MAEKFSTFSLRDGLVVAGEIVAFSALGASLAWMMWALVEPVGPISSIKPAVETTDPFEPLAARLSRIPEPAFGTDIRRAQVTTDAGGYVLYSARAGVAGGGTAIISANGAPQAAFAVGDEIVPGARLARVVSDHVEIDAGSRTIHVAFAGSQPVLPPPLAAPPPAAPQPSADIANSLVNSLSLRPVTRAGGQSGFQVTSEAALSALGGSGLRTGDVLLKIDGVDLSPANLASQASQLQTGRVLDIVYERNGQISTTRIGRADQ